MTKLVHPKNSFAILSWLNVGVGIAMLFWQIIFGGLSSSFQFGYFIIMLLLTGIPHGGLDHVIAKTTAGVHKHRFSLGIFLGRYVVVIALYATTWFVFPSLSLLFFILISAWHFGETDIVCIEQKKIVTISRFIWGCFVLLLILLTHQKETTEVLLRISKNSFVIMNAWQVCKNHATLILITLTVINFILLLTAFILHQVQFSFSRIANLLIILSIAIFLPLLPSFALYFGGWHAIRSFELIFQYLNVSENNIVKSPISMWKKSLPMSIIAGLSFVVASIFWNKNTMHWDPLPLVFIFLSVITLPHLDVMDQMIRKEPIAL